MENPRESKAEEAGDQEMVNSLYKVVEEMAESSHNKVKGELVRSQWEYPDKNVFRYTTIHR